MAGKCLKYHGLSLIVLPNALHELPLSAPALPLIHERLELERYEAVSSGIVYPLTCILYRVLDAASVAPISGSDSALSHLVPQYYCHLDQRRSRDFAKLS